MLEEKAEEDLLGRTAFSGTGGKEATVTSSRALVMHQAWSCWLHRAWPQQELRIGGSHTPVGPTAGTHMPGVLAEQAQSLGG